MRPRAKLDWTRITRWLRGLWPDRNPLRRACDRAEAAIGALLLGAFLIGAPLLALACGQWAASAALRAQDAQRATRYQVTAVLTANAPAPVPGVYGAQLQTAAPARWTAPVGITRTGNVFAPPGAKAGSLVTVWVDRAGHLTSPPLQLSDVAGQRVLAALLSPVVLGLVLLGAWKLARQVLDRRRMAAWDADWRVTGPRWTSLR